MSAAPPFPRDQVADWEGWALKCPWCESVVEAATVSLGDLMAAWCLDALDHPRRDPDGQADCHALTSQCDVCGRPFMVALQPRHSTFSRVMRLICVRTAADARLLAEGRA